MKTRLTVFVAIGLGVALGMPSRSSGQDAQDRSQQPQAGGQGQGQKPARGQGQDQSGQPSQGQGQRQGQGQDPYQQGQWDLFFTGDPSHPGGLKVGKLQHAGTWNLVGSSSRNNSGMSLVSADEALRAQLKLGKDEGLLVTAVEAGSPAAQVGIQPNDVLLRLNASPPNGARLDVRLGKPEDLEIGLENGRTRYIDVHQLCLLRGGKKVTLPIQTRVHVSLGPIRPEPLSYWIGVSVAPIDPALRAQLQPPAKIGLLALDVVKDSPGATAGVRPHDILLRLAGEGLTDQDTLIRIVQAHADKPIPLELIREGQKATFDITPGRRKRVNIRANSDESTTKAINLYSELVPVLPGSQNIFWPNVGWVTDLTMANPNASTSPGAPAKPSQDIDSATTRRLDELSAQIKDLRAAIDALTRATQAKK
jgi:PDZ domain